MLIKFGEHYIDPDIIVEVMAEYRSGFDAANVLVITTEHRWISQKIDSTVHEFAAKVNEIRASEAARHKKANTSRWPIYGGANYAAGPRPKSKEDKVDG